MNTKEITITNRTLWEVKAWLKDRAFREDDEVMLVTYMDPIRGRTIEGGLKRMYTTTDGQRSPDEMSHAGYKGVAKADGVHLTFDPNDFDDDEVFWGAVNDLIREMKNDGFEVRGWTAETRTYARTLERAARVLVLIELAGEYDGISQLDACAYVGEDLDTKTLRKLRDGPEYRERLETEMDKVRNDPAFLDDIRGIAGIP